MRYRKFLRSPLHNYADAGAYFVTICATNGAQLFGTILDELVLNDIGKMIESVWLKMPEHFPTVGLDSYIVMPNHFHGIVVLGLDNIDGQWMRLEEKNNPSLTEVMGAFKSITTLEYSKGVRHQNWPSFNKRLWQRSYFDRVIRNDEEMGRIRSYILNNPFRWYMDAENPHRQEIDEFDIWLKNL